MTASEMVSQYQIIAAFQLITAVVWGLCGVTGLARFRNHRTKLDLGWAAAFLLLALAMSIEGYISYRMAGEFGVLSAGPASILEFGVYYSLRTAAFTMLGAFALLVLYGRRRPEDLNPVEMA